MQPQPEPQSLAGGEISDIQVNFPNYNPPKINDWLHSMFPADPPNGDWSELRGNSPTIYGETPENIDTDRRVLLFKTYNYEMIRRAYILHRQCVVNDPTTGRPTDSQLKALSDNYLMDAYLHWNYNPTRIAILRNGTNASDAYLRTIRENLLTAANSERVLCQDAQSSEIEELTKARVQVSNLLNNLSMLQGALAAAQQALAQEQQRGVEQEQSFQYTLRGLESRIQNADKDIVAAIEKATQNVAAEVDQRTTDLRDENAKLRSDLRKSNDALLASRQELNAEYDKRVAEVQRTERALCAQKVAETETKLGSQLSDLKVEQGEFKSKTSAKLQSAMSGFNEKLGKLTRDIGEKDQQIFNLNKSVEQLKLTSDAQKEAADGMSRLLTAARDELRTKLQANTGLRDALDKLSLSMDSKVNELLSSKLSAVNNDHRIELSIKNGKIAELEKKLESRSERDCALYNEKIAAQQTLLAQTQDQLAQAKRDCADQTTQARTATEANAKLNQTMAELKKYIEYRDREREPLPETQPPRRTILRTMQNYGLV